MAKPFHLSDDPLTTERSPDKGHKDETQSMHAKALHQFLEDRINAPFDPSKPDNETAPPLASPPPAQSEDEIRRSRNLRRALKVLAGVLVIAFFGWVPIQSLLQTSSVEAVVNARLVTLRTPIDGQVVAVPDAPTTHAVVGQNTAIMRVVNPRTDRTRLDDLRRQRTRLESERPAIIAKLASAEAAQQNLAYQASEFSSRRVLQLEARIAEIKSTVEAASARREEANAAFERASSLVRSGTVSSVEAARLTREQTIAQQTEAGMRHRLEAAEVELAAARQGIFLGDSYNDRPSSVQREEEMRQRVETLKADLSSADAEREWLTSEILIEQVRLTNLSETTVRLPVAGRIWEIMTSPGEDVRAGQPLVRVVDCSGAVVTANVTERVYNGLKVGAPALFRPADGGSELTGIVSNLTGSAGAAANLAINPDALNKEPYRVTVSVPQISAGQDCTVGRTGRVIFSQGAAEKT